MRRIVGTGTVIAINVSSNYKFEREDFGDHISGLSFLLKWLNPFARTPNWPTASDIQTQLAWISAVQQERASTRRRARLVDLYIRPPVGNFGTLDWASREEIMAIGYESGKNAVEDWVRELRARNDARLRMFMPAERASYPKRAAALVHNKEEMPASAASSSQKRVKFQRAASPLRPVHSYENIARASPVPMMSLSR